MACQGLGGDLAALKTKDVNVSFKICIDFIARFIIIVTKMHSITIIRLKCLYTL